MTKRAAEYQRELDLCSLSSGRGCAAVWQKHSTATKTFGVQYKDLKTLAQFLPSASPMQSHEAHGIVHVQLRARLSLKTSAGTILDLHTLSPRHFLCTASLSLTSCVCFTFQMQASAFIPWSKPKQIFYKRGGQGAAFHLGAFGARIRIAIARLQIQKIADNEIHGLLAHWNSKCNQSLSPVPSRAILRSVEAGCRKPEVPF